MSNIELEPPYELYQHQIDTLRWMNQREGLGDIGWKGVKGGVISLKMGMGKTLVCLSHIMSVPKPRFPPLIIVSRTMLGEWKKQGVEKFFGDRLIVMYLHRDMMKGEFNVVNRLSLRYVHLVITTYDVCAAECRRGKYYEDCLTMGDEHTIHEGKIIAINCRMKELANNRELTGPAILYGTPWSRIFCDESQRFANPSTSLYKSMMALYGDFKWCITGTPIRNYDTDIWSQLRFCGYDRTTSATEWKRGNKKTPTIYERERLSMCVLMMGYEEAGVTLPDKTEEDVVVVMNKDEKKIYDDIFERTKKIYSMFERGEETYVSTLAMFNFLRQVAIAPHLLAMNTAIDSYMLQEMWKDEELKRWCQDIEGTGGYGSTKMNAVLNILEEIPSGDKVLIFSTFSSCLDLLARCICRCGIEFRQLDGRVKGTEREMMLSSFKTDVDVTALLLTYKVGSEGLNLTEAQHCICVEPWWNNAVHKQAVARCWRMGQDRDVKVYNIIMKDSIEAMIIDICERKDDMIDSFLDCKGECGGGAGLGAKMMGEILGVL